MRNTDRTFRAVAVPHNALAPLRKLRARHHRQEHFGFRFRLGKKPTRTASQNGRQLSSIPSG